MHKLLKTIPVMLLGIAATMLTGCSSEMTSTGGTAGTGEAAQDATAGTEETAQDATGQEKEASAVYADIDIKDYGKITLELDPSAAPETVENFVALAQSGFYNGLTFHRIMEGFMMQGGDPLGNGTGGSDKQIRGEFKANGVDNPLSHTRGAISMARATDMNSASSQFFIVHKDALFLDGQYAAFGYVMEGMDVVDQVCADANPVDGNGTIPAENQPVITSITIR